MIPGWDDISWAFPQALWLLPVAALIVWFWRWQGHRAFPRFRVPYIPEALRKRRSWVGMVWQGQGWWRALVAALMIVALARPQKVWQKEKVTTEGIDIVLAVDVSASMLARDFQPNRLEAAKKIAADFIRNRPGDRIGLVIFAGEALTQVPLTLDHDMLLGMLNRIESGMLEDGTAIGMGLATAIDRLRQSKAKSKVVILLTDGVNNTGAIPPLVAGEMAKELGIRVYTIGVGSQGTAPYPVRVNGRTVFRNMPVEIDEALLKKISEMTDGRYFRATDNASLQRIFEEIDRLEKTRFEMFSLTRRADAFYPWLQAALAVWLVMLFLHTVIAKYWP